MGNCKDIMLHGVARSGKYRVVRSRKCGVVRSGKCGAARARIFIMVCAITCVVALWSGGEVFAQAKISTKKVIISDLPGKTLMVVGTGNPTLDNHVKESISASWRISPFEFCSEEDFLKGASSDKYYYLLIYDGFTGSRMEGIRVAGIYEGGFVRNPAAGMSGKTVYDSAGNPAAGMSGNSAREVEATASRLYNVIEVPLISSLPAMLYAIQKYIEAAISTDIVGYLGMSAYAQRTSLLKGKTVVFTSDSLATALMDRHARDTVVSYVISPSTAISADAVLVSNPDGTTASADAVSVSNPDSTTASADAILVSNPDGTTASADAVSDSATGAKSATGYCYKMLFDCESGEICYYRSHKITPSRPAGFTPCDMKKISRAALSL